MDLRKIIRDVPDFPKPGILFKDITPVMENPAAYRQALEEMTALLDGVPYDKLAAIESRGFIFGGPMAVEQDKAMVLFRKVGKLPAKTRQVTYDLEYGTATLEVHLDALKQGDRVIIVDDLLATGGTARASAQLVRASGAVVAGFLFMVELEFLGGAELLQEAGPVFSLVKYS